MNVLLQIASGADLCSTALLAFVLAYVGGLLVKERPAAWRCGQSVFLLAVIADLVHLCRSGAVASAWELLWAVITATVVGHLAGSAAWVVFGALGHFLDHGYAPLLTRWRRWRADVQAERVRRRLA